MATWQQGINSGGFLAGIGTQNENAPKASDINATLGLIRENNELARSGANNVALTGLRGLAGVADIYKQQQQQERKAAFRKVMQMLMRPVTGSRCVILLQHSQKSLRKSVKG